MGNTVIIEDAVMQFKGREPVLVGPSEYEIEGDVFEHLQAMYGPQPLGRLLYYNRGQSDELLPPGMSPLPHLVIEHMMASEGPFPTSFVSEDGRGSALACYPDPGQGSMAPPMVSGGMVLLGFEGCARELTETYGGDGATANNLAILVGPLAAFIQKPPPSIKQELCVLPFFEVGVVSCPTGYYITFCNDMIRWPYLPLPALALALRGYGYEPDDEKAELPHFQRKTDDGYLVLRTEVEKGMHKVVQVCNITKASVPLV